MTEQLTPHDDFEHELVGERVPSEDLDLRFVDEQDDLQMSEEFIDLTDTDFNEDDGEELAYDLDEE